MGFSEFYSSSAENDEQAIAVIQGALDAGLTFLDTADVYGPFKKEILLGKAIAKRRDQVFLATKFGIQRSPDKPSRRGISGAPAYVRSACDASLQSLKVERIDLYYQHRVDPGTPIEETVGALAQLVHAGKVRYLGLSERATRVIFCSPSGLLKSRFGERGPSRPQRPSNKSLSPVRPSSRSEEAGR